MGSKSKTVLITGATAGIGRAAALALARAGDVVIATGRRTEALRALQEEAPAGTVHAVALDVTKRESIEAAAREIERITGGRGVDVLVNNAGYGLVGPLESVAEGDLREQFDTNVFGLLAVTRAVIPQMRARGEGRIVNVGSMGGRVTFPLMGAYHASKYAVEAISDALRNELAPFGIRVSLIEPGAIRTEFNDRAMGFVSKYADGGSPYAPILGEADKIRAQFEATAVGPDVVVRAIEHAIRARRPRARYVVPFRTHFILGVFKLLPTPWMDGLLRVATGLTRRKLAPPRALAT